jgi:hypothetical protein
MIGGSFEYGEIVEGTVWSEGSAYTPICIVSQMLTLVETTGFAFLAAK